MRAANDNTSAKSFRRPPKYKGIEGDIRNELEDDLINAMDVDQRVLYRRHGIVPTELEYLARRVESEIAAAMSALRNEAA